MNTTINDDVNNTENAGIVGPYELPITEATEATEATDVTEVDLSGYQYDIVPTYKMIEDCDDQDTLFRIQFLQAFGITDDEYHPNIVSAVIDDLYERYNNVPGIQEILESHPLYHSNDDNREMIFCMMFSFQLFDLFHTCLRHAKHNEPIPQSLRDEILESFRTLF
jgi:hypothetical protein